MDAKKTAAIVIAILMIMSPIAAILSQFVT
jgi:hypothetical protein